MNIDLSLQKNKNKKSTNKDFYESLNLERNSIILPVSDINETINTYKVFENERNNCTKYGINITLNPIMSNVLANVITEVKSISTGLLLTGQTRTNAIQTIIVFMIV
jgi:hypothetical protein